MSSDFQTWWDEIGSGIRPLSEHDYEQHGRRITMIAWNDSSVRCTAELARLRAEVAALKADLIAEQGYRAAAEEIARRRGEMVYALIAEVAALKADRDEARRMACSAYAAKGRDLATERGWGCFKEEER